MLIVQKPSARNTRKEENDMKRFEVPMFNVHEIQIEDVITTSGCETKLGCPNETEED